MILESVEKIIAMLEGEYEEGNRAVAIGEDTFCNIEIIEAARAELSAMRRFFQDPEEAECPSESPSEC